MLTSWIQFILIFSVSIRPNGPLLLVCSLDGIQCPLKADESKLLLVSLHWCVHVLSVHKRISVMGPSTVPRLVKWFANSTVKPSRVSSILIGCLINTVCCRKKLGYGAILTSPFMLPCLVCPTWMVWLIGGKCQYSCGFVRCFFRDFSK